MEPIEWEKVFANHLFDKRLYPKYIENFFGGLFPHYVELPRLEIKPASQYYRDAADPVAPQQQL